MQANPNSLSEILAGQKQYVIPVFQRMYEWGKDRWESLWQDLLAVSEDSDKGVTHFIGPMVVIANAVPHDVPKYLVIDGQQRLMTLSVLLAAIRDCAKSRGLSNIANAIDKSTYLSFLDTKGQNVHKIMPRIRDRDALYQIIDSRLSAVDMSLQIAQAYQYFSKELEQLAPNQPGLFVESPEIVLDRLYQTAMHRLGVVLITLGHNDNPSNIYESLNFKHETLTDSALIRNYVFMKLDSLEKQEEFENAYWRAFEDLFEYAPDPQQVLTDFYYRYLISKTEYIARRRLYTEFVKYVDSYLKNNSLPQLTAELTRFARYHIAIQYKCVDKDLEQAFERFRKLDTETAIPALLALYDKYETPSSDSLTKATFISSLRVIESFILRRMVVRERTRGYGLDFAGACKNLDTISQLMNYFAERGWPSDNEVKEALKTYELYIRSPKQCKLILTEIEKSFGHKEKVDLRDAKIEIEHIMPQNLTQRWREMLGINADEIHERCLHTIGNLTLTGYNVELGDRPFAEKRAEYEKSKLSLNSYFDDLDTWDELAILKRTDVLGDRFVDLWFRPNTSISMPEAPKKTVIKTKTAKFQDPFAFS